MKFKFEKPKKYRDMTDIELEQAIKEEKIALNILLVFAFAVSIVVAIVSSIQYATELLFVYPMLLLFPTIQVFAVLASRTEKRIRELTDKWSLKA